MLITQTLNAGSDERAPVLQMYLSAWQQLQLYAAACPAEINGFAYVRQAQPGVFVVSDSDDVFITRQIVSRHSANVDPVDYALATQRAVQANREHEMRLQWHSHVYADAYLSRTDMQNVQTFEDSRMEWFISLVTNKFGDVTARLDVFRPFRVGTNMRILLVHNISESLADLAKAEVGQLVTIQGPETKEEYA